MGIRNSRARSVAVAAVVALTGAACATGGGLSAGDREARSVVVLVENNNWQDATVYVVGPGPRARLGTVTSMTSKRFRVPLALQSPEGLQLQANLIGSSARNLTNRILVNPGHQVRWTLENQLALSSYSVR